MHTTTKLPWRSRGYLPHFDGGPIPQSITFRLANSLPSSLLEKWGAELNALPLQEAEEQRRRRIEIYLDKGTGEAFLSRPEIAELTEHALLFFDDERYQLHAWTIMPNHVHALLTPATGIELAKIVHSWKSFTANKANRLLTRQGKFWHAEYFDRFIRDERHFDTALRYIERNPVKAGLCKHPNQWPFGSARMRMDVEAQRLKI
jgi:REP element-mobilizing transposase RayT